MKQILSMFFVATVVFSCAAVAAGSSADAGMASPEGVNGVASGESGKLPDGSANAPQEKEPDCE